MSLSDDGREKWIPLNEESREREDNEEQQPNIFIGIVFF